MAKLNTELNAEMFKDRRVQIALAVIALLIVAAAVFFVFGATADPDVADAPPVVYTDEGFGEDPFGVPSPGAPGMAPEDSPPPAAGVTRQVANSWSGAPTSLPGAAEPGAVRPEVPGLPPLGTRTAAARPDPFVPTWRPPAPPGPAALPAYLFALPIRLAAPPQLADEPVPGEPGVLPPDRQPLPFVPRRVSGILHNGGVSAIIEIGPPGPQAHSQVVFPGSRVPSGIGGVGDMVVESITPTGVLLRAPDGRTVNVRLGTLPPGVADQLRQQLPQPDGMGGFAPGVGGVPDWDLPPDM